MKHSGGATPTLHLSRDDVNEASSESTRPVWERPNPGTSGFLHQGPILFHDFQVSDAYFFILKKLMLKKKTFSS